MDKKLTAEFVAAVKKGGLGAQNPLPVIEHKISEHDKKYDFSISRNAWVAEAAFRLRMLAGVMPELVGTPHLPYVLQLPSVVAVSKNGARIVGDRLKQDGDWPLVFSYGTLRRLAGLSQIVGMAKAADRHLSIIFTDISKTAVAEPLAKPFLHRVPEYYDALEFRLDLNNKFSEENFPPTLPQRARPDLKVVR